MLTIMHVSLEPIQMLDFSLKTFRQVYEKEPIVVIGDGVCGDYASVARAHNCEWISGQLLKRTYKFPLWSDRLFQICLERKDDLYLNLDPDTKLWRKFVNIPKADVVGSIVENCRIPNTVNGCACFYSRGFVERYFSISRDVWNELPQEYKQEQFTMQAYKHDMWMPFIQKRLNATIANYDEVLAVFEKKPTNPKKQDGSHTYAATHPHKNFADW